jgi:hypothetical protein
MEACTTNNVVRAVALAAEKEYGARSGPSALSEQTRAPNQARLGAPDECIPGSMRIVSRLTTASIAGGRERKVLNEFGRAQPALAHALRFGDTTSLKTRVS